MRQYPIVGKIKNVLNGMPHGKTSSPDRITVETLVHHSRIVALDLIVVVLYFFTRRRLLKCMNHTFLVIIPKNDTPPSLDEYQLISCFGISYKIISKILAD